MNLFHFLLINFFFLSFQYDIIRDLPYNIYHIEDMSKFESKFIQEGTKYYIRLPQSKSHMTLYLTIPKKNELFPLYISEFSHVPNDNEIMKEDFIKEVPLKSKEDLDYSIYSFDIEKSDSYKVLYFKNNEILNYLSLYVHSLKATTLWVKDIYFGVSEHVNGIEADENYFFRVSMEQKSNLRIWTRSNKIEGKDTQIYIAGFPGFPTNETIQSYQGWQKLEIQELSSSQYYADRTYLPSMNKNDLFLVVKVTSPTSFPYFDITVGSATYGSTELTWWQIMLIVIGVIIFIILCLLGALTETGRAICAVLLICCLIFKR